MTHLTGHDRSQTLLLPESLDDYVGPENPVRFIEAFVDGLDLAEAGFGRVTSKETGRPGYAPADLLKLYIYGYLNRIRSSRRLEAETHRNIEVIWLLRHLKPDFKTIADFRRDNRNAFRPVFRQFVLLCKQLDLFGRELLAVDGTRIKAVNNKDRNFTRASLTEFIKLADKKLEDYLQRLDTSDVAEQKAGGSRVKNLAEKIAAVRERRTRCQTMLAELDRSGESQISLTDPDSRAMAGRTHVAGGYNVQVAVDTLPVALSCSGTSRAARKLIGRGSAAPDQHDAGNVQTVTRLDLLPSFDDHGRHNGPHILVALQTVLKSALHGE
jgi:transposase